MTGSVEHSPSATVRAPGIQAPPSLVDLATSTLRRMLITGDPRCGDRIVENRLTRELGISRPPLREALRVLEHDGLVRQLPRRGVIVTPLTLHDIYEICTLRTEFQRLAVHLGVPATHPARLDRCHRALHRLHTATDLAGHLEATFEFHLALVGLSGHHRLEAAYRCLQLQHMLAAALIRQPHVDHETLRTDTERHRQLLTTIEHGHPDHVLAELDRHTDRTFLHGIETKVD
ncbi:GntR family transcriptional regulator [Saccharopolyspora rosea]|uniref:GntR family transcriptional regulator n=1 Tax=Saccharopolyspora rosea TaxID=524884 RepID=A0ABW3FSP7_9PSEU|nr:GntR family transcriptional regulator [Saccharopolyspora rosea]